MSWLGHAFSATKSGKRGDERRADGLGERVSGQRVFNGADHLGHTLLKKDFLMDFLKAEAKTWSNSSLKANLWWTFLIEKSLNLATVSYIYSNVYTREGSLMCLVVCVKILSFKSGIFLNNFISFSRAVRRELRNGFQWTKMSERSHPEDAVNRHHLLLWHKIHFLSFKKGPRVPFS